MGPELMRVFFKHRNLIHRQAHWPAGLTWLRGGFVPRVIESCGVLARSLRLQRVAALRSLRFLTFTTRRSLTLIVTRINWFTHSAQTSADTRRVFHPVKALVTLLRPSTIPVDGRVSF